MQKEAHKIRAPVVTQAELFPWVLILDITLQRLAQHGNDFWQRENLIISRFNHICTKLRHVLEGRKFHTPNVGYLLIFAKWEFNTLFIFGFG